MFFQNKIELFNLLLQIFYPNLMVGWWLKSNPMFCNQLKYLPKLFIICYIRWNNIVVQK